MSYSVVLHIFNRQERHTNFKSNSEGMKHITKYFFFALLLLVGSELKAQTPIYKQANIDIELRIEDLLKRMTLEEKIAQIKHIHSWDIFDGQELNKKGLKEFVNNLSWGFVEGFPLTGENCKKNFLEIQKYMIENTRLGIPIFIVGESLHGSAHEGSTIFPQNIALGSTFNPKLAKLRAQMTSKDLHYQGIRQVLAPCIDVVRDIRWGRVEEAYAEDPYLSGVMAVAEVEGYLESGIQPMLKHYGPHGNPVGGLNLASVKCGMRDLHNIYLKPFEMVVKQTPIMAVMSAYNSWNHIPNSASYYLMTEILREQWGFQGYIYSDWGAINLLESFHKTASNSGEAAQQALSAGLDVEASSNTYPELIQQVKNNNFDFAIIDTAVSRVLRAKFRAGLFEDPYGEKYRTNEMHSETSIKASRKIADESTVLLKNDNNILPLNQNEIKSIAVVGPNANQVQFGDYTWSRDNKDGVTPLQGIKNLVGNTIKITYAKGAELMTLDQSMIPEAVEAAKNSELTVIFCGSASASLARDYSNANSGEGFDLHDLTLTGAQPELIKAIHAIGKPVILVLTSGKPFAIEWEKDNIPAILAQWYAGEQAGNSIADILFGNVNPSGHLTFSFPKSAGHLPAYYNHLPTDRGYYKIPGNYEKPGRDYVLSSPTPLWAFGHGLSYTTFEFNNLTTDKEVYKETDTIEIQVDVTNKGDREGKEVVQVYIRDVVSSIVTPIKQLKAFDKINLKPNQTQKVKVEIPISELYLLDEHNNRFIEAGDFEIQVGNSSDNILLTKTISVGQKQHKDSNTLSSFRATVKPENNITITGIARDVQATPVSQVEIYSVLLDKKLTVTNSKGEYSIEVPSNDILLFTRKGYAKQEIEVNNQTTLNLSMHYTN